MKKLLLLSICLLPFTAEAGLKAVATPSSGQVPFNLGTPAYTDTGTQTQYTGNLNGYIQSIIQNTNSGSAASSDFIVSNDLGTGSAYYGDFGINSSTFSGADSFSLPNATYLYSQSGDLSIGTLGNNSIHFEVNSGTSDAMTINAMGQMIMAPKTSSSSSIFPNAMVISTNVPSGIQSGETMNIGVMAEGQANSAVSTQWGIGVYGHGYTNGATRSAGLIGEGQITAGADTGTAAGVRGYALAAHAGGFNVGLLCDAQNGSSNYCLYMNTGDIFSNVTQNWFTSGLAFNGTSATEFSVGQNGATNPALNIDTSTASSTTGINIKSAATGGTTIISATDSGANSSIAIQNKGASTINLNNVNYGDINLQGGGTTRWRFNSNVAAWTPAAVATLNHFLYTTPNDLTITASTEMQNWKWTNASRQWATGTVALQREYEITAPTYTAVAASTFTEAATLSLDGPPIAGTNATITQQETLRIGSGTIALENGGTTPTVSTCGSGVITAGSGTHKGVITGVTAATACTITFAAGQPLPAPQTCTIIGSAAIVSPVITSISATAVTFGMTAYTGTLYYHCL